MDTQLRFGGPQRCSRVVMLSVLSIFALARATSAQPIDDPIPESIEKSSVRVVLETLATGLTAPNWGTTAPGDTARLFVTDQDGILWAIDTTTGTKSVFLDVSARLVSLGIAGPGTFDERGLLGVAFHPDYETNGLLYTYTSEPVSGPADFSTIPVGESANHQTVIIEWNVPDPTNPASVVDPLSARELLRIDQPQFNHDGGGLVFGPDGMLYISLGDGGAADDQGIGHGSEGNGQDPSNPLGAILRIDPLGSNSANGNYGIPPDNPFVGTPGFVEEIYAYGLRNPFRFSFDRMTGDGYVGDVGQNDIEEVDLLVAGANYGWRLMEGSFFFDPNGSGPGFVTATDPGGTASLVRPIAEYDHDEGLSVIGGFVYRGGAIPELAGRYVFGDFARTFNNDGRLFHLDETNTILELNIVGQSGLGLSLLGFGEDAAGEIYVMANATGTPFGNTGVVLRITPAPPLCGASPEPAVSCREHTPGKSFVTLIDKDPNTKDQLKWNWKKGAATDLSAFGDPLGATPTIRLCVYDTTGKLAEIDVPPGGTCDGKPCWKTIGNAAAPKGFLYKRKSGAPDGIVQAKLKAGVDGKALVQVKGKGSALALPATPLSLPATVQLLVDAGTLECWQATYTEAKKNEPGRFKAKAQ